MKKQVASIQNNISGGDDNDKLKSPREEEKHSRRSRGVRRASSSRLATRSSSREFLSPTSKMPSVSPGRSHRRLSNIRSASFRNLKRVNSASSSESFQFGVRSPAGVSRTRRSRSSSRESLRASTTAPSKRLVRKSTSGIDVAMVGTLGDPSRHALARSKSGSDANVFSGNAVSRGHQLRNGNDSGGSFSFRSPSSDGSRRGKLRASPSGGLIQASSKDTSSDDSRRSKLRASPSGGLIQASSKDIALGATARANASKKGPIKSKRAILLEAQ